MKASGGSKLMRNVLRHGFLSLESLGSSDVSTGERRENEEVADRPRTVPATIPVCVRAFDSVEHATDFANLLAEYVRELSRWINLERLDGLTVAHDYAQALLELDRGYETSHCLRPTDEHAVGVAMTPAVIRDGIVKSHIVFNAAVIQPLEDQSSEMFRQALHLLAHECAHVEATYFFDTAFPGTVLQRSAKHLKENLRWQIINATWDEFAATWICANIGANPIGGYEETFLTVLSSTRENADRAISAYRNHRDVGRVAAEVFGIYGALIKFAAYLLGTLHGQGLCKKDLPETEKALREHWFAPHFDNLFLLLKDLSENYGEWTDLQQFEALGNLAEEVIADGGLTITHIAGNQCYVDVPFGPHP